MELRMFAGWMGCGLIAAWLLPACAAEERTPGSSLAELLEYAREHNPGLTAARLDADAATQRAGSAAALPDPVLRTELMNTANQGASLLPWRTSSTRYTLIQNLPWHGKLDLKQKLAEADAERAWWQSLANWADLSAQIKSAYAQYYYVAGNQKITRDLLDLVMQIEKIAQVRYANGLAPQQDALRAQAEQIVMRSALAALDHSRRQSEARLNVLLSRPLTMPLASPQNLRSIPATASLANHEALENRIREHNPDLFMAEAWVRTGEKTRDLAYLNRYPDFALGISPTQSGNAVREWGVMVELNIPLQQEVRRSQERESEAMLAAARSRKQATADRLLSALFENLSAIDAAQRIELLGLASLLPQVKATFESALTGYQTGKVDFATLLDAAQQILNARLEILKSQVDAQLRLADIERLLGDDL